MNRTKIDCRKEPVMNSTLRRDYRCGICYSKLVERYLHEGWAIVCPANPSHDVQEALHVSRVEELEAAEILAADEQKDATDFILGTMQEEKGGEDAD